MKKLRLIAVLLAVCLLCSACVFQLIPLLLLPGETTESTEPSTEAAEAYTETPDWSLVFPRQQNAGSRDYLPDGDIEMLRFADIAYTRPDADALCEEFSALTAAAEDGAAAEDILSSFYPVYDNYYHFYTMDTVANIRYYADMSNTYYQEEYEYIEQAAPDVEEKFEGFLKACALSSQKAELEVQYFGEGFLDQYVDYSVYTNPEYLALAKQEKAALEAYHTAMEDPKIVFNGKEQSYQSLVEQYENSPADYIEILETYYDTYNPILGQSYVELIRIRRQMAEVLGYDSYADLCYEQTYGRDYTPQDASSYVAQIRSYLAPLFSELMDSDLLYASLTKKTDEAAIRSALRSVVTDLGGVPLEAYNFMIAYDLSDVTKRDEKMETSFTTYLQEYEAPYILLNATGTADDIFTFAHEFGHFTDSYYSYQNDEDLETAETFSQGMEWLALCHLNGVLSEKELENARLSKLADTVSVFVSQAAYSDFEDRVYALEDDELSVEAINSIYRAICKDYGFYLSYADFYYSMGWIDIPHFYEAPYYVISYCVSADTALQIYQRELAEEGGGVALYFNLLDRTAGDGVQAVAEAAGMENPFADGRIREIRDFLSAQLSLD